MHDENLQQSPKKGNNQLTQAYKMIVDFYKDPLVNAIKELQKNGYSLDKISKKVFKGEISKQAISQNYLKKSKGGE